MKQTHMQSVIIALAGAVLSLTPTRLSAQRATSGAELQALVNGLTVTARVLVVGMHPDDEDSQLLAYLARGHQVQTAYLSVTRGESAGNFLGPASGTTLGAARTQETLAARRIDGAEQFFTRMYDFGYARSDSELFARWNRDSLVGDIVTVIRSFRPHVIVVNAPDSADDDVQHRALFALVTDARRAAAKGDRYRPLDFGDPWGATLFRRGAGDITMDADSLDPVLGETYAAIAERARAQYRTQGLLDLTKRPSPLLRLAEILPPSGTDSTRGADGVLRTTVYDSLRTGNFLAPADTSLSRLRAGAPPEVARLIPPIAAHADS
ncbi:MAG TPA: PIG-L family deacetylase, partial [Gemmatimonadaceae bacterium]